MTVHSFHIFDRKGKTLFTKCYVKKPQKEGKALEEEEEQLSEQRKLVFGMLFSLRELSSSLSPSDGPGDLQMVKTGASTLYNYETVSGLRFVLYTSSEASISSGTSETTGQTPSSAPDGGNESFCNSGAQAADKVASEVRAALKYIYETIYITSVIRSPMYRPGDETESIKSTNFEAELEGYLKRKAWFR